MPLVDPTVRLPLTSFWHSVVAVHGLNFKNNANHAHDTWTLNDRIWLKDFLPSSLGQPARILLFEYNSSPALDATAIKLADHARSLLQWLSLKRTASIVFALMKDPP